MRPATVGLLLLLGPAQAAELNPRPAESWSPRAGLSIVPGGAWETRSPAQAGMSVTSLHAIRNYLGGRGAIVRGGYLVYTWGDPAERADVASAAKPVYAHFLFEALEHGLLASLDTRLRTRA